MHAIMNEIQWKSKRMVAMSVAGWVVFNSLNENTSGNKQTSLVYKSVESFY